MEHDMAEALHLRRRADKINYGQRVLVTYGFYTGSKGTVKKRDKSVCYPKFDILLDDGHLATEIPVTNFAKFKLWKPEA